MCVCVCVCVCVDGKLLRGNIRGKGDLGKTVLTGFLLKAAQSDLGAAGG